MMQCRVSFVFYIPRPPQASSSCVHMVGYTTQSLSPLPLFPPHSSSSSSSSIYRAYEQSWNAAPFASTDQLFLIPSSLSLPFFLAPSSVPPLLLLFLSFLLSFAELSWPGQLCFLPLSVWSAQCGTMVGVWKGLPSAAGEAWPADLLLSSCFCFWAWRGWWKPAPTVTRSGRSR